VGNAGRMAADTEAMTTAIRDLTAALNATRGPIVEVAGPTTAGFAAIDAARLEKPVLQSNLMAGLPLWGDRIEQDDAAFGVRPYHGPPTPSMVKAGMARAPKWLVGRVDFQADATALPLRDKVLGAVLVSCLNRPSRPGALREAARVLEAGGLLVWQGAFAEDLLLARSLGLELVAEHGGRARDGTARTVVFQKPSA